MSAVFDGSQTYYGCMAQFQGFYYIIDDNDLYETINENRILSQGEGEYINQKEDNNLFPNSQMNWYANSNEYSSTSIYWLLSITSIILIVLYITVFKLKKRS